MIAAFVPALLAVLALYCVLVLLLSGLVYLFLPLVPVAAAAAIWLWAGERTEQNRRREMR